ncbi:hypothetical protein QE152_g26012 [Popillia japonica]|uniref:Zinc finger PHD-type domain-containing protein n=1 Tax=Popillia japonica TaxID=7064 RepID=A0AAW1JZ67_POPJA
MNSCKNCTIIIKSNSSNIQCDACRGFIHATCAGISENDAMITRAKARCIKIVCNNCNSNMAQFGEFKTLITSLKTDFASAIEALKNEFNEKLNNLKREINCQNGTPKMECNMEDLLMK